MSAVFTPTRARVSVDRYHKMIEAGVFEPDERIELIEGEMIEMAPVGSMHIELVNVLAQLFFDRVKGRAVVSVQNPIALRPYSEPQPDLVLLVPEALRLRGQTPEPHQVMLVIEIADSTLAYDRRTKAPLYAKHGIAEFWLFDVQAKRIEVFREPSANGYALRITIGPGERIAPLALPDVFIAWDEVFEEES